MKKIVLMYHRVEDGNKKVSNFSTIYKFKRTVVSPQIIQRDVEFLRNRGWLHVGLSDFKHAEKGVFHLSFDDGYIDHIETVVPLLRKLKIKQASFSITTSVLENNVLPLPLDLIYFHISHGSLKTTLRQLNLPEEQKLSRALEKIKILTNEMTPREIRILSKNLKIDSATLKEIKKQYMRKEDVVSLAEQGFEICSHGVTHRDLTANVKYSYKELKESKEYLANLIGEQINVFSFPDGQYNTEILRFCNKAGYKTMLAIEGNGDSQVLPRVFATSEGLWQNKFIN